MEAYNGFAKCLFFGGEGVIDTLDPVEQEKHLKYNHLVANAAAIQNVIDLTRAVRGPRPTATSSSAMIWRSSARTRPADSSDSATTRYRSAHLSRSTANFWCRSRSTSRPRPSSPEAELFPIFGRMSA